MGISKIVKRCRSIHRVNMKQISLIPDMNATVWNFENDEGRALIAAADQYSSNLPRHRVAQIQGSSEVKEYDLANQIEGWGDDHFIEYIQYPLDVVGQVFMDQNFWDQILNPADERYILKFNTQFPTGPFGILYGCPHIFDLENNESSISFSHEEALAQFGAAFVLEMAANLAAQFSDRQIFENKDLGGLADRLQARADKAFAEYDRIVSMDSISFHPTFVDWDVELGGGRGPWDSPFHPSSLR